MGSQPVGLHQRRSINCKRVQEDIPIGSFSCTLTCKPEQILCLTLVGTEGDAAVYFQKLTLGFQVVKHLERLIWWHQIMYHL